MATVLAVSAASITSDLGLTQLLLALVQQTMGLPQQISMLVLTSGTFTASTLDASSEATSVAAGSSWGLVRVLRLEVPNLPVLSADVTGKMPLLGGHAQEPEVVWTRGGVQCLSRLRSVPSSH